MQSDAVIAARARTGGFRDFDDLAASTGLPASPGAPAVGDFRAHTTGFGLPAPPPPGGRILISDWAIRVGAVVDDTVAEGPGRRFAVWVQGCSIRCPGCFNPHLWGPHGGTDIDAGELAARALAVPGIGGHPAGRRTLRTGRPLARFASSSPPKGFR